MTQHTQSGISTGRRAHRYFSWLLKRNSFRVWDVIGYETIKLNHERSWHAGKEMTTGAALFNSAVLEKMDFVDRDSFEDIGYLESVCKVTGTKREYECRYGALVRRQHVS